MQDVYQTAGRSTYKVHMQKGAAIIHAEIIVDPIDRAEPMALVALPATLLPNLPAVMPAVVMAASAGPLVALVHLVVRRLHLHHWKIPSLPFVRNGQPRSRWSVSNPEVLLG